MIWVCVVLCEIWVDIIEFFMIFCYFCCVFVLLIRGFILFMFGWLWIYYKLLNLLLSILVKSKFILVDFVLELGLDIFCLIMYVLLYNLKVDLLMLCV